MPVRAWQASVGRRGKVPGKLDHPRPGTPPRSPKACPGKEGPSWLPVDLEKPDVAFFVETEVDAQLAQGGVRPGEDLCCQESDSGDPLFEVGGRVGKARLLSQRREGQGFAACMEVGDQASWPSRPDAHGADAPFSPAVPLDDHPHVDAASSEAKQRQPLLCEITPVPLGFDKGHDGFRAHAPSDDATLFPCPFHAPAAGQSPALEDPFSLPPTGRLDIEFGVFLT